MEPEPEKEASEKVLDVKDAEKEEVVISDCPVQAVVVYPDRAEVSSWVKCPACVMQLVPFTSILHKKACERLLAMHVLHNECYMHVMIGAGCVIAQVTRLVKVELGSGDREVVLKNLSKSLDKDSVRVDGIGPASITEVSFQVRVESPSPTVLQA